MTTSSIFQLSTNGGFFAVVDGMNSANAVTDFRQTANCFSAYEVNPAKGCGFGCEYCSMYAQMERKAHLPVFIFKDYPEHLRTFIKSQPDSKQLVFNVSPQTDFFSQELIESGMTKAILNVFMETGAKFYSLTKAGLPPKEIQEQLISLKDQGQIIISSGLPDEKAEVILEPKAPPSRERMAFAKFCNANAIPVTGIIAPYLPLGGREEEYRKIILNRFKEAGISHCSIQVLKVSKPCLERVTALIPGEKSSLDNLYFRSDIQEGGTIVWALPSGQTQERSYAQKDRMAEILLGFKNEAREMGMTVSTCVDVEKQIGVKYNREANRRGFTCVGFMPRRNASCEH